MPLDNADLAIEPFNEAERHLVLGLTVSGDTTSNDDHLSRRTTHAV